MTNPRRPRTKLRPRNAKVWTDASIICDLADASTTHIPDMTDYKLASDSDWDALAAPFNASILPNATFDARFERLLTHEMPQRRDAISIINNDLDHRYIKQSDRNSGNGAQTRTLAQLQQLIADAEASKADASKAVTDAELNRAYTRRLLNATDGLPTDYFFDDDNADA